MSGGSTPSPLPICLQLHLENQANFQNQNNVLFEIAAGLPYRRIFVDNSCCMYSLFSFSDQAIKLHLWILPEHNRVIYLWKFEPKIPNSFGEIVF